MRKLSPFFNVAKHFHSPLLVVDIELESLIIVVVVRWRNNQDVTNKCKWYYIAIFLRYNPNEIFNFEWVFGLFEDISNCKVNFNVLTNKMYFFYMDLIISK